jgi:hypothetical protein
MELAEPFELTQPAILRHLKVLEGAGLIVRRIEGTKRPCRLAPGGIAEIDQWLGVLRKSLAKNYDRLDDVLAGMEPKRRSRRQAKLKIETDDDRFVVVIRRFAAPPEAVYRGHIEPALIQRWMLGPDGWSMPGVRRADAV